MKFPKDAGLSDDLARCCKELRGLREVGSSCVRSARWENHSFISEVVQCL